MLLRSFHPLTVAPGVVLGLCFALPAAQYEVAQRHPQATDAGPGTTERPWQTLSHAAAQLGPGDRLLIRGGLYRERVLLKMSGTEQSPIRLEAAPGERVIVTGADLITNWKRIADDRPVYSIPWKHNFIPWNRSMAHPDDAYHQLIGRCEQVRIEGYPLRQVLAAGQLAPGTFFADTTAQTLQVWDVSGRDPNQRSAEASVRQEVLQVEGDYVQVRGLQFRYAANMAQHGAVVLAGRHDVLEDCVIEDMNASGAGFVGEDAVVRRCVFRHNGQLGFGAGRAHRLLLTGCVVEDNNAKGFDRGWEAGGTKLVLCRDVVLERSQFVRNRGNGVWFDIGNTNCTVRHCLIADNEDAGVFYEISFHLHAHDNVITGNGFAATPGAWGAQAGISLSSSPGCVIERNILFGNREGFNFREQQRTTPTVENPAEQAVWNHDELIRHNLIVANRDAQVWGWFDVGDNRHWPSGFATTNDAAANPTRPPADLAAAYGARGPQGQPQGLTLELLHLRFENNVYHAAPGQGTFTWGTTWGRHRSYPTLNEFQTGLGIDHGGQSLDPGFLDALRLDLRLRPDAAELVKQAYPQGPVPGVRLGLSPPAVPSATTQDRTNPSE